MCIRIYCVGFSPQRSALTLVVMVHPPSIIIYIDAFVFSPRYKKGTFPFAANGRAMSVNETEGMIKVRVAWMRGGCVCMNCMRARLCEWCLRACVSQPGIHLPHTLLAALSHSSPPPIHSSTPPRLHLSASPPLRLSVRRSRCWRTGRRTKFLVSILSVPTLANLSPKGFSRWSTSYAIRPMAYVLRHTPYVSQSLS